MATAPEPMTEAYLALIRAFPLRPIRDEAGLDRAIAVLDTLIDRDDLTPEEDDYMHDLGTLVEAYEDVHWPMRADLEDRGLLPGPGTSVAPPDLDPTPPDPAND